MPRVLGFFPTVCKLMMYALTMGGFLVSGAVLICSLWCVKLIVIVVRDPAVKILALPMLTLHTKCARKSGDIP